MKYKKGITITNAFQKILKESNRKPNKIWIDKRRKFYKSPKKSYKSYKYLTSISKNVYIDKLDDKVNKYNNRYHRTTKIKPFDVKESTNIDFSKELMMTILNLK